MLLAIAVVVGFYRVGVLGHALGIAALHARRSSRALFAHTLVPIAFAYVLAHYFSLLVWQGQAIGYLASNPLGHGTRLLRHRPLARQLRLHRLDRHLVRAGARARQRATSRGLTLAHDRALADYRSPQQAVRSQYWMLVVMVGFTSLGLWLLSAVNT